MGQCAVEFSRQKLMPVDSSSPPFAVIVMGVAGSGKSTFAKRLAEAVGMPFLEGDEYHAVQNVAKMQAGIALEDVDRWPWLGVLARALRAEAFRCGCSIASCSALKRVYRDRLRDEAALPIVFVHLVAPPSELAKRISQRTNHFMPASLLYSQLLALQPPLEDEHAIILDSTREISELLAIVLSTFRFRVDRSRTMS